MPLFINWNNWKNAWKGGGSKNSLRRYYIIAGTYLAVIVMVFSLLVLRWGPKDLPELSETPLPPLESPLEEIINDDFNEASLQPFTGVGTDGDNASAGNPIDEGVPAAVPDAGDPAAETAEETAEAAATAETEEANTITSPHANPWPETMEEKPPLPVPAQPLPRWELHTPFGHYGANILPSGGLIHQLSRGVLLQAEPASYVSVLWDGNVSKVTVMQGLYRCSVLVQHDGGYSTYYGNLREVWVKEGAFVSRGENIGVMPYSRGDTDENTLTLPVSGNIPATGRSLEVRTVWSGTLSELPQQTIPALQPPQEGEGPTAEIPLLYLEVRQNSNFLDPLNFIRARN